MLFFNVLHARIIRGPGQSGQALALQLATERRHLVLREAVPRCSALTAQDGESRGFDYKNVRHACFIHDNMLHRAPNMLHGGLLRACT